MYVIKATYTSGDNAGRAFILTRGGHIHDDGYPLLDFDCYKSETIAKEVARKLAGKNIFHDGSPKIFEVVPVKRVGRSEIR